MAVVVPIRVEGGVLVQFFPEPIGADIRPRVLIEKDNVYAHILDVGNGISQLLLGAEAWIGIMRGVAAILSAIVPPHKLNGLYSVLGTVAANLWQVLVAQTQIILRRINIELLPGMYMFRPGRSRRTLEPGVPPSLVSVDPLVPTSLVRLEHHTRKLSTFPCRGEGKVGNGEDDTHGKSTDGLAGGHLVVQ